MKGRVGIIHMHGVLEGWFEHINARKWISRKSGIPIKDIHLLDVSDSGEGRILYNVIYLMFELFLILL